MEENRILYNELCPTCETEGQKQKLFLDTDRLEIRCELGHMFEELPSDKALRSGQEILQTEQFAVEPEPVSDEESASLGTVPEDPLVDPLVNTLEEAMTVEDGRAKLAAILEQMPMTGTIDDGALQAVGNDVTVSGTSEFGLPGVVKLDRVDDGTSQILVAEGRSVNLPNGDVLLCVRIPELWKSAVEAEAEAQLKSPAQYFGEWLTSEELKTTIIDWLQNYWTSAYSQTV